MMSALRCTVGDGEGVHSSGKPGKVGEFEIGREKSRKIWFACGVLPDLRYRS